MRMRSSFRWPRARSRSVLVRLVRGVWTLPTNLVGHAVASLLGGPRRRVEGPAAVGWLYPMRAGVRFGRLRAITLGHAILHRRSAFAGADGRAVLAHELAHTRQHDRLGPLYLPLHGLAQLVSCALSLLLPGPVRSRVHDHNPLEQAWICLGATACDELAAGELVDGDERERYLQWLGVPARDERASPIAPALR